MLDLTQTFAKFPVLESERCILRAPTDDDLSDLYILWSNPQVARYLGRPTTDSIDEAAKRLQERRDGYLNQAHIMWVIASRTDQRLMGTTILMHLQPAHHRAELGYELMPESWGKGLIPEVGAVVVNYAFTTMGLHSLEARIDPENIGSRRVLEKLGFVQEGYFREDFYEPAVDRFTDTAVFSLLKADWAAHRHTQNLL
jgi:[ribosomal protein S5]-alanine N-acetyltransferase